MTRILVSKVSIYVFIYVFIISIFIGLRTDNVGADTKIYYNYFESLYFSKPLFYEPFFELISRVIGIFTDNRFIYFFILSIIFNLIWFSSWFKINKIFNIKYNESFFYFIALSLMSSWYITALTNGLRQGLAIALLYLAIINLVFLKRKCYFFILYLSSCLFHYSNFIFFPIFFIFLLNSRWKILFLIISLMYPLGLNEKAIYFLSNILSLELYSSIKNYISDEEARMWVGFQINFYLYSLFWFVLTFILNKILLKDNVFLDLMLKIYCVFLSIYFIYGFGAFSNRFAFVAWLFLPFLQYSIICAIREKWLVKSESRCLVIYIMILISIFNILTYYGFEFF